MWERSEAAAKTVGRIRAAHCVRAWELDSRPKPEARSPKPGARSPEPTGDRRPETVDRMHMPLSDHYSPLPRHRAHAPDRPLAPGVAGCGVRGAAARVARCGGARGRQVGARCGAGGAGARRVRAAARRRAREHRARAEHARTGDAVAVGAAAGASVAASITTDGEFHTIRRQLDRLAEEGLDVVKDRRAAVPTTLAERLARAVDDRTAAVLVSSVLFETAEIVPGLDRVAGRLRTRRRGAARRCLPPSQRRAVRCRDDGSRRCVRHRRRLQVLPARRGQLLSARAARTARMRPVLTGWFAEFDGARPSPPPRAGVTYGAGRRRVRRRHLRSDVALSSGGGVRIPRGAGTDAERLRAISRHQVGLLEAGFAALDIDPARRVDRADARGAPRRLPRDPDAGRGAGRARAARAAGVRRMREATSCAPAPRRTSATSSYAARSRRSLMCWRDPGSLSCMTRLSEPAEPTAPRCGRRAPPASVPDDRRRRGRPTRFPAARARCRRRTSLRMPGAKGSAWARALMAAASRSCAAG